MTREETKIILRAMMASYPTFKPQDLTETIDVWAMMLEEADFLQVQTALKEYVKSNATGFAPSIGQLLQKRREITNPAELDANAAWGLVMKAIKNGNYGAVQEYEKLPKLAQMALGSPSAITNMGSNDHFDEGVEKSHFIRAYNNAAERVRSYELLSPDTRRIVDQVNQGSDAYRLAQSVQAQIERHHMETEERKLLEEKKAEFTAAPDSVRRRLEDWEGYTE